MKVNEGLKIKSFSYKKKAEFSNDQFEFNNHMTTNKDIFKIGNLKLCKKNIFTKFFYVKFKWFFLTRKKEVY